MRSAFMMIDYDKDKCAMARYSRREMSVGWKDQAEDCQEKGCR